MWYRNPNHWTNLNEIWHGDTPQWGKGLQLGFDPYHNPQGQGALNGVWHASAASTIPLSMWLGQTFLIQKIKSTSILFMAYHMFALVIWIWKNLGHMYFWSCGQSFSSIHSNLAVRGGGKMGLQWFCSLSHVTWQNIHNNKDKEHLNFIYGRSHVCICNLDLEGPGPHVLLEQWSIIFRQILHNKHCNSPSQ
jgi:hypothetical protein